jgi:hypothetical protein
MFNFIVATPCELLGKSLSFRKTVSSFIDEDEAVCFSPD